MMTSLWFLVIALLAVITIGFAVADVFWPITVGLVIGTAILWWWSVLPTIVPLITPVTVGGYVVIGLLWVFFKWTRLVEKAWREGKQRYGANLAEKMISPPKWSDHSWDFSAYFFYWPIDMIAYTLSDLLQEMWTFVSSMVSKSFNRYAEWRFARLASKD